MNILIPHSWLLEHLETDASPEKIQSQVSLCGPSIERIYQRKTGPVYDIEVTTNRVDSMSVQGIAREAAVILSQFGTQAHLIKKQWSFPKPTSETLPLPVIFNAEHLGKRVLCVILKNVQRTATPQWMADKLTDIDQNVHDSVIDITNYVTHELGHPIHAFDYDAIMKLGGEIHIVTAEADKPFTTLDGQTYTTVGGEVVFENQKGEIIDLPSIKGTVNSSISDTTQNVLLWIESIPASKVRFASMTHAIRTVAAQLSEKNLDPHLADATFARAIELYQDLCGALIASEVYDDSSELHKPTSFSVPLKKIDTYLGLELPVQQIVTILENLECQVILQQKATRENTRITVQPPTFRPDLTMGADVVEEIARIYGYHNLPSTLMQGEIPTTTQAGVDIALEESLKDHLANHGWQELYTYSFVSDELAQQSGYPLTEHISLQNPLTDDKVHMRRSLIPSLKAALEQNMHSGVVSFFEIAQIYIPQTHSLPDHQTVLALVSNDSYQKIRNDLESLLHSMFITQYHISQNDFFQTHADIVVTDLDTPTVVGTISRMEKSITALEIQIAQLTQVKKTHPTYTPIPKTHPVIEDLTFTLPATTLIGNITHTILEADQHITEVLIKDQYKNNVTFTITYLDTINNMSSERVEPIRKKVVETIEQVYSGVLVGSV